LEQPETIVMLAPQSEHFSKPENRGILDHEFGEFGWSAHFL
jgi:hypothetical protein